MKTKTNYGEYVDLVGQRFKKTSFGRTQYFELTKAQGMLVTLQVLEAGKPRGKSMDMRADHLLRTFEQVDAPQKKKTNTEKQVELQTDTSMKDTSSSRKILNGWSLKAMKEIVGKQIEYQGELYRITSFNGYVLFAKKGYESVELDADSVIGTGYTIVHADGKREDILVPSKRQARMTPEERAAIAPQYRSRKNAQEVRKRFSVPSGHQVVKLKKLIGEEVIYMGTAYKITDYAQGYFKAVSNGKPTEFAAWPFLKEPGDSWVLAKNTELEKYIGRKVMDKRSSFVYRITGDNGKVFFLKAVDGSDWETAVSVSHVMDGKSHWLLLKPEDDITDEARDAGYISVPEFQNKVVEQIRQTGELPLQLTAEQVAAVGEKTPSDTGIIKEKQTTIPAKSKEMLRKLQVVIGALESLGDDRDEQAEKLLEQYRETIDRYSSLLLGKVLFLKEGTFVIPLRKEEGRVVSGISLSYTGFTHNTFTYEQLLQGDEVDEATAKKVHGNVQKHLDAQSILLTDLKGTRYEDIRQA